MPRLVLLLLQDVFDKEQHPEGFVLDGQLPAAAEPEPAVADAATTGRAAHVGDGPSTSAAAAAAVTAVTADDDDDVCIVEDDDAGLAAPSLAGAKRARAAEADSKGTGKRARNAEGPADTDNVIIID